MFWCCLIPVYNTIISEYVIVMIRGSGVSVTGSHCRSIQRPATPSSGPQGDHSRKIGHFSQRERLSHDRKNPSSEKGRQGGGMSISRWARASRCVCTGNYQDGRTWSIFNKGWTGSSTDTLLHVDPSLSLSASHVIRGMPYTVSYAVGCANGCFLIVVSASSHS